jgi:hypothetical protein
VQSIELAVVGFVMVFFIAITFYVAGNLSAQPQASQAELNVLAQQILQRITAYSAYNLSQDVGVANPSAPGYLSDYAIDYLAMASAQLSGYPTCSVWNPRSTLASTVGTAVYMAGYGYVIPNLIQGTLNLTAIARNLFGNNYNKYDVEIQIKPLVRLAVCPYVTAAGVKFMNNASSVCKQFYNAAGSLLANGTAYIVARGAGSYPSGRVVSTVYYCTTSQCYPPYTSTINLNYSLSQVGGYYYSYAKAAMPPYVSYSQLAGLQSALVVYAQKIDYPYSAAYYVFNATSVSLIYGAPLPGAVSATLYLIHDADYVQPGSNLPCDGRLDVGQGNSNGQGQGNSNAGGQGRQSLGIRYISLYTGYALTIYGSNITLNPGTGNSPVKVQQCSQCINNAHCTACWLDLPTNTLLALAYVTPSSSSPKIPQAALVPIPLFPVPPATDVDVKTWYRWGFYNAPQTYASSASGVFNSLTTTYLVNVTVYEYPSPMR